MSNVKSPNASSRGLFGSRLSGDLNTRRLLSSLLEGRSELTVSATLPQRVDEKLEQLAINTIRTLAIDGVQAANSGHPGAPMGAAPMAYVIWTRFLRHAPTHARLVGARPLRAVRGHASMLLYSLLHLTGYDLPLDELKRSASSARARPAIPSTASRPASTRRPVRSARASPMPSAWPSPSAGSPPSSTGPATTIVDHWIYGICSDGDLQEGISAEAASLAGHLRLGRLVFLYDDNLVQLDGPTSMGVG